MAAARNREIAPLFTVQGFTLSRSGGEMHWRIPGKESVSIRGNMWYSHYREEGGDAISLARRFFHMDFKEAVRFLLEQSAVPAAGSVQCERQEQKQLRLPPKDSSEEQVRRYLTGIRKVSADVAGYFIETGQVYQSRAEGVRQGQEQCNLVLVGMDRDGAPRQAHIKGMRQRAFRYDAPGSDKAYGFRHMGGSGPLYVFEAAIDLMSYVSLCSEDWRQGNYLALNGTAETALFRTLEEYPEVRGVVLALDNDAGGIEGVMRLTGLLREKGYTDVSVQLPAWKDWNEELKARGGMDAVCAQPHPKLQMLEQVKDAVLARAVQRRVSWTGGIWRGHFKRPVRHRRMSSKTAACRSWRRARCCVPGTCFVQAERRPGLTGLQTGPRNCTSRIRTISRRMHACGRWADRYRKCGRRRRTCRLGRRDSRRNWRMAGCTPLLRRWRRTFPACLKCPDGKVHRRKRKR